MARNRVVKFTVSIRTERPGSGDLPGFLDMLRYEGGQVTTWDRTDTGFSVGVRVPATQFVPRRWESFGIYPTNVEESWS